MTLVFLDGIGSRMIPDSNISYGYASEVGSNLYIQELGTKLVCFNKQDYCVVAKISDNLQTPYKNKRLNSWLFDF